MFMVTGFEENQPCPFKCSMFIIFTTPSKAEVWLYHFVVLCGVLLNKIFSFYCCSNFFFLCVLSL